MSPYLFTIKNEKIASYKRSIIAIIGLNLIFFIYLAIATSDYRILSLVVIGITSLSFIINHYQTTKNKKLNAVIVTLGLIIITYIIWQFWWQAFAMLMIVIFHFYSIRILKVFISTSLIKYPSFPVKEIEWSTINNLLLKDGLLTIDFKNNKLIQVAISTTGKDEIYNEKEFNDFCQQQINK